MSNNKKPTLSQRMDNMENQIESMLEHQKSSLDRLSESRKATEAVLDNVLEKLNSFISDEQKSPSNVAPAQEVKPQPAFYNYQTSRVSNTVVEAVETQPIGCFDILKALVKQFGTGKNGLSVSAPHVKKDGTVGNAYILNMPRIDSSFELVDQTKSEAQQRKQSKALWKSVAFNNFLFTGKYWKKGEGMVFTTYIKQASEPETLEFLKGLGVHIPQKDHRIKEE